MTKYFVTFLIPGMLFHEEYTEEVSSWSPDAALELLRSPRLKRLAGVTYGFYFTTRSRTKDELNSHTSAASDCYFLGGMVETQAQIRARQDPAGGIGGILLRNMETNKWDRVITVNTYAGKVTLPMQSKDVNLPYDRPPYD